VPPAPCWVETHTMQPAEAGREGGGGGVRGAFGFKL
jgi:hypothetical protein